MSRQRRFGGPRSSTANPPMCRRIGTNPFLPSDVVLKLPGHDEPIIVLIDRAEVQRAGLALPTDRPILFCGKIKRAHEYLEGRGASPGPIQDGGGTQFFEVRDPEGNVIEVCREPQ